MSSLFEHLAATDESTAIAHRKAAAVANKRVKDTFGAFFANAGGNADLVARIALVEDEVSAIIHSVVAEYGGDRDKIHAAIKRSLGPIAPGGAAPMGGAPMGGSGVPVPGAPVGAMGGQQTCPQCGAPMVNGQCPTCQGGAANPQGAYGMTHNIPQSPSTGPIQASHEAKGGFCDTCKTWKHKGDCNCDAERVDAEEGDGGSDDGGSATSSFRTARRPKLCPYHSEVVDVSLGSGDPQAGFNAMSSHAWGEQHCKGSFEGACNFRPSMVTQKYWDDKQTEYADRREQRDRQNQPVAESDLSIDTEPIMHAEPLPDEPGKEGVSDIDGALADAPSAVGGGELAVAASTKQAEALKTEDLPTGDESALGGPSPKIDKGNSGDQEGWSLEPIDTEMKGSPNPSVEQDPTSKADYSNSDFLDQTDAVSKSETLPTSTNADDAGFASGGQEHGDHTKTFPKGDQAKPVTRDALASAEEYMDHGMGGGDPDYPEGPRGRCPNCNGPADGPPCPHCGYDDTNAGNPDMTYGGGHAMDDPDLEQGMRPYRAAVDPDKNPLADLIEEYSGFLMPNQVESALRAHESRRAAGG